MKVLPVVVVVPDEYALLVGKIITLWAYEEFLLKDIVYTLSNTGPKLGRLLVKDCRAYEYAELITTLLEFNEMSYRFDTATFGQLLEECESNRNMFAHSVWIDNQDGTHSIQITKGNWPKTPHQPKISKKLKPEGREMSMDYCIVIFDLVETAIRATTQIKHSVLAELQAHTPKCSSPNPQNDPS